jgi:HSP20 family protein
MALARWNPWGQLFNLHDQMDQIFGQSFNQTLMPAGTPTVTLPLDIRQTDEAYFIEASVPGFAPDEVEVTLDENVLTIRGEHRQEKDETRSGYVRRERRHTSVLRQVGLPSEVKADEISAGFENGVLTVEVPRAQKAQPRRIEVNTGGQKVVEGSVSGAAAAEAQS